MIDVHILLMGNENKALLKQCTDSLRLEPIKLHYVRGIVGHAGKARASAMLRGYNEYVGWVDPDDFIIPGAYSKLLKTKTDFAWMNEEIWSLNDHDLHNPVNRHVLRTPHHMHIIHRDILDTKLLSAKSNDPIPFLRAMRSKSTATHVDEIGYVWREYTSPSKLMFRDTVTVVNPR